MKIITIMISITAKIANSDCERFLFWLSQGNVVKREKSSYINTVQSEAVFTHVENLL